MTYLIQGKIIKEEKPEIYMNTFVDFQRIKNINDKGQSHSRVRYITTNSEKIAYFLNKRGHNLQWNENLERAIELCEQKQYEISQDKIFAPKGTWEEYLTKEFAETKNEKTIGAQLKLWNETRLPTPWLYMFSKGKLENVFIFYNNQFIIEPRTKYSGDKTRIGLLLSLPGLNAGISQTRTRTYKKTAIVPRKPY